MADAAAAPAAIRPLAREEIVEMLDGISTIRHRLLDAPHRVALDIDRELEGIASSLGDCLPGGGPALRCEACREIMGQGEVAGVSEDGNEFCADCVARFKEAQAQRGHEAL